MAPVDDDIPEEFMVEVRGHLATAKAALLAIEDAGADVDEDLVNEVFRAAHSIKGASGFFGLDRIKELAHKAETVLDLVRSRKLVPNAEITSLLLAAFDKLREMVNAPASSAAADTSGLLASLGQLAASENAAGKPGAPDPVAANDASLPPTRGEPRNGQAVADGSGPRFIQHVQVDFVADVEERGLTLAEFFRELGTRGVLLDCRVDEERCGLLGQPRGRHLDAQLIFASKTAVDLTAEPFFLDPKSIRLVSSPESGHVPPPPSPRDLTVVTMTMPAVPDTPIS
jgi:two-component system, chemotaxis family, sensor kinase CheA